MDETQRGPMKVYTLKEACEVLRTGHCTLRELVYQKKIRYYKVGNRYRFTAEMLEEFTQGDITDARSR